GVTVSKFEFTSSNEAFVVDRLAISNTAGSDVTAESVELNYKNQAGEDKVASGFLTSNLFTFEGLELYVAKDSTAVVTVKVTTGAVTSANTGSGDSVGIDLYIDTTNQNRFRAVGSGSGSTIDDSDVDGSFADYDTAGVDEDDSSDNDTTQILRGNNMEIRKTKPTISLASGSPSGTVIAGIVEVLRFNVTADSRGSVVLESIQFKVSATDSGATDWDQCTSGSAALAVGDIYLYDSTELSTDLAADSDIALLDSGAASCGNGEDLVFIDVDFFGDSSADQTIAAGATKTYILKLDVVGTGLAVPSVTQDDSMRVDISDEANAASGYDTVVWQDSNATGTDGDNSNGQGSAESDFANQLDGGYIKNLPIIGGALIF
ncbi:MAG: hypothetical protein UW70_C0037G0001, partial [Candidatus Peregrinibacteria bacterium GW2011_GWA2_44_7]